MAPNEIKTYVLEIWNRDERCSIQVQARSRVHSRNSFPSMLSHQIPKLAPMEKYEYLIQRSRSTENPFEVEMKLQWPNLF